MNIVEYRNLFFLVIFVDSNILERLRVVMNKYVNIGGGFFIGFIGVNMFD